ncbi:hypothetical protein GCM10010178_82110 [Lentzea flava]|uniref:Uncharacterized protein n=1 Tax=Lentzea flava TaxID=103732 RepID=A0ABQ2VBL6_9PSEU|nr:hypothetical protein GCM10010178_82110 [Lentzea flava]
MKLIRRTEAPALRHANPLRLMHEMDGLTITSPYTWKTLSDGGEADGYRETQIQARLPVWGVHRR